ncbi:hypothetical protein KAI32_00400 [Candidatus Pacearchaeota archaeon]|nr:hypothetical protein [Candidatus Pacearchaeota archaeon]
MEKIKGLAKRICEHPTKTCLTIGAAWLIAITSLNDNVHFGSTTLYSPQGNHYIWGLFPETKVEGRDGDGKVTTIGALLAITYLGEKTKFDGDINGWSFGNTRNYIRKESEVKNVMAYSLVGAENHLEKSQVENVGAYGSMGGRNKLDEGVRVKGNIVSKGLFAEGPDGVKIFSNSKIGLENYVHTNFTKD